MPSKVSDGWLNIFVLRLNIGAVELYAYDIQIQKSKNKKYFTNTKYKSSHIVVLDGHIDITTIKPTCIIRTALRDDKMFV